MDTVLSNNDLLSVVLSHIDIGRDYKVCLMVCTQWRKVAESPEKTRYYMNVLSTLIKRNPQLSFLISEISDRITIDIINLGTPNFDDLSLNPRLTRDVIFKYQDALNWLILSECIPLNRDLLIEFKDKWDMRSLSQNPTLTEELVDLFPIEKTYHDIGWITLFALNKNIDSKSTKHIIGSKNIEATYNLFSNPSIFKHALYKSSIKIPPKMASIISTNTGLTEAIIRENAQILNWVLLTHNRALTMSLIREYIDKIDWTDIVFNPNIDANFINEYKRELEPYFLSQNEHLTPALIREFAPEFDWGKMSKNRALTYELMEEVIDCLIWCKVFVNPNVTLEFLEKHIAYFDTVEKYVKNMGGS